jgi:Uma2 family endonuclease
MTPTILEKTYTADEFYTLPVKRAELVRGKVVIMSPTGGEHGHVVTILLRLMGEHVSQTRAGWLTTETGFLIARDPDVVRAPDAAFVSRERVPRPLPTAYVPFAPDLAIEVVSPGDTYTEVQDKVGEYLAAAVREVWVIDPRRKRIQVQTPGGATRVFGAGESLTTSLLPGWSLTLEALFAPPDL